jgi:hypothetical protein
MRDFSRKPRVLVVGGGTLAWALEKSFSSSGIPTFRAGRNPGVWHLDLSGDLGSWQSSVNMMVVAYKVGQSFLISNRRMLLGNDLSAQVLESFICREFPYS